MSEKKQEPKENEEIVSAAVQSAFDAKVKEYEMCIEELNIVNNQLQEKIEEQELLLANKDSNEPAAKEKKKPVIPSKSFKVDKEEYVFTIPHFTNPLAGHSVITAEEALTNKELLEYLAKNDTGIIKRKGE